MRRSEKRILTTHTGSLPRPLELTKLYAKRARGEPVDAGELAAAGKTAMNAIVAKQVEAGIDIGNNGEQQREAFFLYVRTRMSGFGGAWTRPPRGDVEHCPAFKAALARDQANIAQVSSRDDVPTAIGDIRYLDHAAIDTECTDFRAALALREEPEAELGLVQALLGSLGESPDDSIPGDGHRARRLEETARLLSRIEAVDPDSAPVIEARQVLERMH
jgi:5-methyltetrahydropteroyltriglutamate--homocysteine methyltransferase